MPSRVLAALVVVGGVLVWVLGSQASAATSSPAEPPVADGPPLEHRPQHSLPGDDHGAPSAADGVVPDGLTVFGGEVPALAKLDPDLLRALRLAATDAARDGVEFQVNSGWRSRRYQEHLFREAVSTYGSHEDAARLVATPGTSAHESGNAVDIGPADAAAWLSTHGAVHGLCQIYGNEPWHYELRPEAVASGCPPTYADARAARGTSP